MVVHCAVAVAFQDSRTGDYLVWISLRRSNGTDNPLLDVNGYSIGLITVLPLGNLGSLFKDGDLGDDPTLTITVRFKQTKHNATFTVNFSNITADQFISIAADFPPSSKGQVIGFMGNFNGNSSDDMFTRPITGNVNDSVVTTFDPNKIRLRDLYDVYIDSWRLNDTEGKITYENLESTANFTDKKFRGRTVADYYPDQLNASTILCRARALPDWLMSACISDVTLAEDPSLVLSYPDYTKFTPPPTPAPRTLR
eukprot:TRINITY_DN860_c0_g1_i2.p1 TRINITY_DN860_c0_g1~~TRINITY_DN860_c0_g1_i2.p1  ORF type:complete len:264 (-),score=65.04 TRINITY_DN860_c0_g1_i2:5-766(-)